MPDIETSGIIVNPTLTEESEILPNPEGNVTGNSVRGDQTVFDGASFILRRNTRFNRILFRITGQGGAPTLKMLIFQGPSGGSGVANRIATVSALAIPAAGVYEAIPAEGLVLAQMGLIYVLYGRDSAAGSFTMRTYTTQQVDLLTANVNVNTHPTSFITAISTALTPATFNPLQTPTGEATGTGVDVVPIIRLRRA